ncbi:MAG: hypothetical protein JW717_05050 [Marinilabiliaceae bacterium]|nr:hypothetical protein [Marinilabiliaceae bacterium]
MKIIVGLLMLISLSTAILSQQKFNIQFSEKISTDFSDLNEGKIINDNFLLTLLKQDKTNWSIVKYKIDDMSKVSSTPVISDNESSNCLPNIFSPLNLIKLNNTVYILLSTRDRNKKQIMFFLQQIDNDGKKTGDLLSIGYFKIDDIEKANNFQIVTSDDQNYCGITTESFNKHSDYVTLEALVFNSKEKKVKSYFINTSLLRKWSTVKNAFITNKGQIIIPVYQGLNSTIKPSMLSEKTYRIFITNSEYSFNYADVVLPNYAISSLRFQLSKNQNDLIVAGSFSDIEDSFGGDDSDGIFMIKIDIPNTKISSTQTARFNIPLIAAINDKKEKQVYEGEGITKNYQIKTIIENQDQSCWLLLEKSTINETYALSALTISKIDISNYKFETILAFKTDKQFSIINSIIIPKKQYTLNDFGYASSFFTLEKNNNVYIFFNDFIKNTSSDLALRNKVKPMMDPQKDGLFCARLNDDGTYSKQLVLNYKNNKRYVVYINSKVASDDNNYIGISTNSIHLQWQDRQSISYFNIKTE